MDIIQSYFKKYINFIIPFSIFIFTFFIYLHNLSRFVYGGDVGDLLLAVGVKGVAHPSGYPLFTLLGIIFTFLPINQPLAYKVGLISVLFSSASVVLLYLISFHLTKNKILSIVSSLILAFSYIFWLYAEVAEVFALAAFLFLLLSYLGLKYYEKKINIYLYLLSFSIGLSLSHHLMILAIFPSLIILTIGSNWKKIFDFKTLLKCIALFLLGLLPYLYIPVAASHFPSYSWGNVTNLKNFIQLITRADYAWVADFSKEKVNSSVNLRILALLKYYVDFYHLITPFALIVSLFGIINLLIKRKYAIFFSLFIAYFLTGPFYIFYGATPNKFAYTGGVVERFYTFSLIYMIIFFSLGCSLITDIIEKALKSKLINKNRTDLYKSILFLTFFIIPIYLLAINFRLTDLSNASIGEEFGKDYLRNLPRDSFVFISGDTATLNTWYVQHVLGFRRDIIVINPQQPSLNIKFVKNIYPEFTNLKEEYSILKSKINKSILESYNTRPVFAGYGATSIEEKGIEWIPLGLSQRMVLGEAYNPSEADFIKQADDIWKNLKFKKFFELTEAEKNSQTLLTVQSMYSYPAVKTGVYLMKKYSNLEEAKKYFELADQINPNDNLGKWGLANYYFDKRDCRKSEEIIVNILNEDKEAREAYIYLYIIYSKCSNDKSKTKQIEEAYREKFKEELPKNKNQTLL
ncbi:MAG: DUF2723 domain-containing protein [Candidatus Levybacteria bacterium]|nr:DUF2723 domain-containing protein [Candidatus Levybacteria bacterium]